MTSPTGVDAVRDQIAQLAKGSGSFDGLLSAVSSAQFSVRSGARDYAQLAQQYDYAEDPDSWTDTVQQALFRKLITREQYDQLAAAMQPAGGGKPAAG